MISVTDVTLRYGAKLLFEDVSTQFIPGRRFGLTAQTARANRPS